MDSRDDDEHGGDDEGASERYGVEDGVCSEQPGLLL
jgi:hypothetical protein